MRRMRVISLNLNGIRAAARKGFYAWLRRQRADVVCLQEIKAQVDQLTDRQFWPPSFQCYYHPAEKKGYSGVALYARREPDEVIEGIGWPDFDAENLSGAVSACGERQRRYGLTGDQVGAG